MDKKLRLIIIAGVILVAGGLGVYALSQRNNGMESNDSSSSMDATPDTHDGDIPTTDSENGEKTEGRYVDYSEEAVAQAKGEKILFFHAPWCPQCVALDRSIKESTVPDGVTIFKVDYDSNQALRAQYGVTLQTTLVEIDDQGNKVKSFVAYDDPSFDAVKQEFF